MHQFILKVNICCAYSVFRITLNILMINLILILSSLKGKNG
ncbi:MAG TPA: hypothetical protein [Caudoviricetes sp.]|nr:MAG TPA: hypothetical protein [Caudoviricetes sp.]